LSNVFKSYKPLETKEKAREIKRKKERKSLID